MCCRIVQLGFGYRIEEFDPDFQDRPLMSWDNFVTREAAERFARCVLGLPL